MQQRIACLLLSVGVGCLVLGGCVVAPPRAQVVAVAPAAVWVPSYWYGGVWIRGHWRYR